MPSMASETQTPDFDVAPLETSEFDRDWLTFLYKIHWGQNGTWMDQFRSMMEYWRGNYEEEIPRKAWHESGHALVEFLFGEVQGIRIPRMTSRFRTKVEQVLNGYPQDTYIDYKDLELETRDLTLTRALAGIASTSTAGLDEFDRGVLEQHAEIARNHPYLDSLWGDFMIPYANLVHAWEVKYGDHVDHDTAVAMVLSWIEEVKIIFSKAEYKSALSSIAEGVQAERVIENGQEWIEKKLKTKEISAASLENLRNELKGITIEKTIDRTRAAITELL